MHGAVLGAGPGWGRGRTGGEAGGVQWCQEPSQALTQMLAPGPGWFGGWGLRVKLLGRGFTLCSGSSERGRRAGQKGRVWNSQGLMLGLDLANPGAVGVLADAGLAPKPCWGGGRWALGFHPAPQAVWKGCPRLGLPTPSQAVTPCKVWHDSRRVQCWFSSVTLCGLTCYLMSLWSFSSLHPFLQ